MFYSAASAVGLSALAIIGAISVLSGVLFIGSLVSLGVYAVKATKRNGDNYTQEELRDAYKNAYSNVMNAIDNAKQEQAALKEIYKARTENSLVK